MSFADHFVLWLHIGFAVFTVGPVTLAISSTPRYIRKRDITIVRYLTRITTIFTGGSLLVLILGIVAGQLLHELSKPWLTAAITLFVVALVLLVLVIRDQRKAIRALEAEARAPDVPADAPEPADGGPADQTAGCCPPRVGRARPDRGNGRRGEPHLARCARPDGLAALASPAPAGPGCPSRVAGGKILLLFSLWRIPTLRTSGTVPLVIHPPGPRPRVP